MSHAKSADHYGRRLALLAVGVLLLLVLIALLGPKGDPARPWYEHTGVEGEIQILDAITIVRDNDPLVADALPELSDATHGVDAIITEDIVQEDPLNPLPKEQDEGESGESLKPLMPEETERMLGENPVELKGQSQQSLNFVLLHAVNPRYPDGIEAALRRLEIVVATHLYVDEQGKVAQAYVSRNDGGPRFERAALDAVRQWVYKPVLVEGKPTGFWDTIYFVFRVGSGGNIEVETGRDGKPQRPD